MSRFRRWIARWIAVNVLLACALPVAAHAAPPKDYWMYVGSFTSNGGEGIYLFKFHTATGRVEPAGLAAGRLWRSNTDTFAGSLQRIMAQIRAEWPNVMRIALGVENPTFLAIHPNGVYLYSADTNEAGTISAFQIDPATGKLTMLNKKRSGGGRPSFVTVDQTGKNVLVANYDDSVAVLPIDATGRLQDASCVIRPKGSGADRERQSHPHSINVAPDNRFVIVADWGLDELLVYKFNPDKGTLEPNDPPFVKTPRGSGARHLSFHPNGKFAYVNEEVNSSVTAMKWEGGRGVFTPIETVRTVPKDFHGKSAPAEVLVHPSGRFLCVSNRGPDSIAVFTIDPETGSLTPVEYVSAQGKRPRGIRIDPSGKYLFAANVSSGNVVQFRIDGQTGRLIPTGIKLQVGSPACIKFAPAD